MAALAATSCAFKISDLIVTTPFSANWICPSLKTSEPIAKFIFIDIYMDGFSLHWQSAPLRRTVNYRVALVIRVPKRIGSATIQLTGGQPGLNRLRVVSQITTVLIQRSCEA